MIPGLTTRLSEAQHNAVETIHAKTDILILTGPGTIQNIIPNFEGFSGFVILVPANAGVVLGGLGNIHVGFAVDRAMFMVWTKYHKKWIIGAVQPI